VNREAELDRPSRVACSDLLDHHGLNIKCLLSINSNDSCLANPRLLADVLVTVKEQSRLYATNVAAKCLEAQMNLILSVVDVAWRIVCDEHVNWRKCRNQAFNLILVVEKVTSWLVTPRASEATENQATIALCAKMQIKYGGWKRASAIVIALNGKAARALCHLCRLQNDAVIHITAGNQNIGSLVCQTLDKRVFVGNDEELHGGLTTCISGASQPPTASEVCLG